MTIDMLRHASLRRLIELAVEVSAPAAESWPAHDARVAAFAVRNLPHNTTPERAAALMDATVTAAPELKRRAGVKGWHQPRPQASPRLHPVLGRHPGQPRGQPRPRDA